MNLPFVGGMGVWAIGCVRSCDTVLRSSVGFTYTYSGWAVGSSTSNKGLNEV